MMLEAHVPVLSDMSTCAKRILELGSPRYFGYTPLKSAVF